ncbi:MAG: hypothetical protein LBQ03_02345 [Puniceicoccales bacterium]|jgi:beta-lactamase superfamily II metal-dependent hydrolase|nr:hypothetical protein [Puniceicoccales bacterium]
MKQLLFVFFFIFPFLKGGIVLNAAAPGNSALEMYVFSVGQGNFVLLKKGNSFLTVDVGCGKASSEYTKSISSGSLGKRLRNIGVDRGGVVHSLLVTHNHKDHFYLFPEFLKVLGKRQVRIPQGFYNTQSSVAKSFWSLLSGKEFEGRIADNGSITNCLGNNVTFRILQPPHNATKDHEKNLIVFVKCKSVLFILPGDADGDYLNLNAKAFINELRKQATGCTHCCIVLPHHGSNSNGTLALSLAAQRILLEKKCRKMIFIISSNSMEGDHLPRSAVLHLLPATPQVKKHSYQCQGTEEKRITSPVFITSKATDGIGYLITTNGNNLILYDGTTINSAQLYPRVGN